MSPTSIQTIWALPLTTYDQLGEGGMQDIFYGIREKTRVIADHHASLGKTVEMSIVQHLQKLRAEIKAHIRNIQMDTGKLANVRFAPRQLYRTGR